MNPTLNMDEGSAAIAPAGAARQEECYSEQERTALLFMLEDLERSRHQIEQAHHDWIAAMDAIHDPIFMHDKDCRVMRSNRAYAERAGMSVKEVIGKLYWEAFPRLDGPLSSCGIDVAEEEEEEEEEVLLESGEVFLSRSFAVRNGDGSYLYSLHVMEDITERKQLETDLLKHEADLVFAAKAAHLSYWKFDITSNEFIFNDPFYALLKTTAEQQGGYRMPLAEYARRFVYPDDAALVGKDTQNLIASADPEATSEVESRIVCTDGEVRWMLVRLKVDRDAQGNAIGLKGINLDISERKQAEEELRLRAQLLDSVSDTIFVLDFDGNFVYLNEAAWKSRGYTRDEMMGINLHVLDTPEYEKIIETRMKELREKGQCLFESEHRRKDGSVMPVEISASLIELGGRKLALSTIRDITERKRAEQLVRSLEARYRMLFDHLPYGALLVDPATGQTIEFNEVAHWQLGYSREEFAGLRIPDYEAIETHEEIRTHVGKILRDGRDEFETKWRTKQGELRDIVVTATTLELSGRLLIQAVSRDITLLKQAEMNLRKTNRAFRTLSTGNHGLVHATDELQLLQGMCRVIVETGGYSAAWVGYARHDAEKTVCPMAQCGFETGYVDALQVTWADSERGQGPTGKAVRGGMTQVVQDVANNPGCAPWREQALKHGHTSAIALPLLDGAEAFGSLTIYAAETNTFDQDEVALLREMADDLAFGIRMLRLRQAQQRDAAQVRKGLEEMVGVIADTVEMRDPYTAGHQRRVAQLAAAIALEMGLPEEQVRGVHLAGTIHDLGKIQTPAEILSKPGKLSATEFNLIKDHPQNGYEILKDIEFPWPIAQMVLQHHERLDGSGYPQKLQEDEILLEARIIAVADVMEAMSSHRPYRPGLGMEVALAEITKGRGTHYDPDAVDACVKLFKENGFKFA